MIPTLALLFCVCLFLGSPGPVEPNADVEHEPFLDLLGLMADKERFRFQYELNGLNVESTSAGKSSVKHQSLLVDEAYSFELAAGRLLLDPSGLAELKPNGYNAFFWFRTSELQESFWLKPFICTASVVGLDDKPLRSGLLDGLLPEAAHPLLVYARSDRLGPNSKRFALHGLAALLVNALEAPRANLSCSSNNRKSGDEQPSDDEERETVEWTLKVSPELEVEFSLLRGAEPAKQLENLRVSFNKIQEGHELCLAQLQILKLDLDYSDELVLLPQGYSCQRSAETKLQNVTVVPLSTQRGLIRKFTLEVTVTTPAEGPQNRRYLGHFQVPRPLDSISKPRIESRLVTWVEDELSKHLIVISQLRADLLDTSKETSTIQPSLSFYNFNTMRHRVVHGQTGPCDQQVSFKSSLFSNKNTPNMYRPIDFCGQEGIEIELSKELSLRLNQEGLKLLKFTLQDRSHSWHLIDQIKVSPSEYEMVYEQLVNEKLCVYDKRGKRLISSKPVKLISRYSYNPTKGLVAEKRWTPKSSSLLFFEENSTGLLMQIDFKLLHFEDYNPWARPRHLLDLSPCFQGPKQSARLSLEYPITRDIEHLRQFAQPHMVIREALASYFRMSFSMTWERIPAIEVIFKPEMVQVNLRLLDQSHLLDDSEQMPISRASKDVIMGWLSQSVRSVLLGSLEACAEYCQQYHCHAYTYCKYSSSCYLFNNLNTLRLKADTSFGSFRAGELDCPSYTVSASRLESANIWRKNSWSLEEALESVVNAVLQPETNAANPYANVAAPTGNGSSEANNNNQAELEEMLASRHRLSVMRPNIDLSAMVKGYGFNMLARLKASYAHFAYDNLHGTALSSQPNPFSQATGSSTRLLELPGQLSNFRVALAGYEYAESARPNKSSPDHRLLGQVDLEDASGGWLAMQEPDVEACARLCLGDLQCASFSYCTTSTNNAEAPNCIISTLDNQGFSLMTDSLLNGVPFADAQQSTESGGAAAANETTQLTLRKNAFCSILLRTYSDQFRQLELKMLYSTREVPLGDVESVQLLSSGDQCAALCARLRLKTVAGGSGDEPACLSYDFCRPFDDNDKTTPSACVFYNKHQVSASTHKELVKGDHNDTSGSQVPAPGEAEENLLGLLKGDLGLSLHSFCTHYVRNFLADFRKLAHRRLPADMSGLRRANFRLALEASSEAAGSGQATGSEQATAEENEEEDDDDDELLEEVSLDRCARLCEEEPNCGAFHYCSASSEKAPGGLYLSCSLGGSETLELSPESGGIRRKRQEEDLKRLLASKVCSVYVYKSLSLVLGHKKKNLAKLAGELVAEAKQRSLVEYFKLVRLDLIVLFFFLVFGFLVNDVDLRQFTFRRLSSARRASDNQSGTTTTRTITTTSGGGPGGRASSIYYADGERLRPNEFKLETINAPGAGH